MDQSSARRINSVQLIQGGLIQRLTGASGSTGIQKTKDVLSLRGIFSLVTQVLGATWNPIRGGIMTYDPRFRAIQ